MFKNSPFRAITIAAAIFAAGAPSSAQAVVAASTQSTSGISTVTMTVPDVIILDYFNNINLGLAGQAEGHKHDLYSKSNIGGSDQTIDGTGKLTTDTLSDANLAALKGSDINLTLKNAWAVRGFSNSGKATVSIDGDGTLKKASSTSTIGVSKLLVMVDGAAAGSAAKSVEANLKGIQKANATLGDVVMGLNFSGTSSSGDYTGTFTITAVTM
jgi:hypothetical protein